MSIHSTTTIPTRTFTADENSGIGGFTAEEITIGSRATFTAYRRNHVVTGANADHDQLWVHGVTNVSVYEFKDTQSVHIDLRDDDGHGHSLAMRSADDIAKVIDLLTAALADRTVL